MKKIFRVSLKEHGSILLAIEYLISANNLRNACKAAVIKAGFGCYVRFAKEFKPKTI